MSRRFFLFFGLLLFSSQLFSQTSLDISGNLHSELGVFTKDWKSFSTAYNWLRFDVNAHRNSAQLHTRVEFWYNGLKSIHGLDDNPFGTPLREFQIYVPIGPVDIRVGKQLILWGTTDELNPTDVINPENYYKFALPVKAERKIPTFSAKIDWYNALGTFTGVFVPFFTPDHLPPSGDPWEVPLLAKLQNIQSDIYARLQSVNNNWRTEHPQFAVNYSNYIGSTDFSVSYYNGVWSTPSFRFIPGNFFLDPGEVVPEYLEFQMAGADFQTAFGAYTFRGEFAYYTEKFFQSEIQVGGVPVPLGLDKKPQIYGIIGMDRFLFQTWYLNLQFGADHIFEYSNNILRNRTWYLGSVTLRKTMFREKLQIEGAIFGNFVNQDYFTRLTVMYKIQDALHISILGNLIGSEAQEFIGQYKAHDQVSLRVEYYF